MTTHWTLTVTPSLTQDHNGESDTRCGAAASADAAADQIIAALVDHAGRTSTLHRYELRIDGQWAGSAIHPGGTGSHCPYPEEHLDDLRQACLEVAGGRL